MILPLKLMLLWLQSIFAAAACSINKLLCQRLILFVAGTDLQTSHKILISKKFHLFFNTAIKNESHLLWSYSICARDFSFLNAIVSRRRGNTSKVEGLYAIFESRLEGRMHEFICNLANNIITRSVLTSLARSLVDRCMHVAAIWKWLFGG